MAAMADSDSDSESVRGRGTVRADASKRVAFSVVRSFVSPQMPHRGTLDPVSPLPPLCGGYRSRDLGTSASIVHCMYTLCTFLFLVDVF